MNDINLSVPFFSQRKNKYIWKNENTNNTYSLAAVSCNITSLCMILNYLGITQDTPAQFSEKIFKAYADWNNESNGYNKITIWDNLQKIPEKIYSVEKKYIELLNGKNVLESVNKYLQSGYPIIFSNGFLAKQGNSGHIAVIRGITKFGDFIINDPWGDPANSKGLLNHDKNSLAGMYVARKNMPDILYGKGSGDNCFLAREEIERVIADKNGNFHGGLVIKYPFLWKFPLENYRYIFENNKDIEKILEEVRSNLNFLITNNGEFCKGLILKNIFSKEIYSCGPGRIIAIRNCKDYRKNFIIVRYEIPGSNREYFFINYKHLAYVDIRQEVEKKIYSSDEETLSWWNQLIKKIKPKSVIFDKGITNTGDFKINGNIPERGYVYLIPRNNKLRRILEDMNQDVDSYLYELNNIDNYKESFDNEIFFTIKIDEEEKKINAKDFVPQTINYREFLYYRNKVKALINEEVVYFYDEDLRISPKKKEIVNEKNYKEIFKSTIQDVFHEIDFTGSEYNNHLKKVESYYKNISINTNLTDNRDYQKEFVHKCKLLCKYLLEIPWDNQKYAFTLNDNWFDSKRKKIPGEFISLRDVYSKIEKLYKTTIGKNNMPTWSAFEKEVQLFYPSNIDFFLEVTNSTVLGFTPSKTNDDIYFGVNTEIECFSIKNILKNGKILKIEDKLNKKKFIEFLIQNKVIDKNKYDLNKEVYLTSEAIAAFNKDKMHELLNYVIYTDNPFIQKRQKKSDKDFEKSIGFSERDEDLRQNRDVLFIKNIISFLRNYFDIDINKSKVYYFNLIQLLQEISKKQQDIFNTIS